MPTTRLSKSLHDIPLEYKLTRNTLTKITDPINLSKSKKRKKKNKSNIKKQKSVSQCSFTSSRPNSTFSSKNDYIRKPNLSRSSTVESVSSSTTKLPSIAGQMSPRLVSPSRKVPALPQEMMPKACERRKKLPLLAAIKPENEKAEKDRFMRANFLYNPYFIYRFPADPEVLERTSQPSNRLLTLAVHIMELAIDRYGTYEEFEAHTGGQILTRPQIMNLVKRYVTREGLEKEVVLNLTDELLSRGSMTRCNGKPQLNVRTVNLREMWVEGLLRHELGTHYLRSVNNRYQPWNNWKTRKDMGLGPMNPTEEGLASLHSVLFRKDPSLWRCAILYYTVYQAAHMSLKNLFQDLGRFVSDPHVRWDYCIRAKRGQMDTSRPGAFCKDQVYLEGALQILKHRRVINFHHLIRMGKVAWQDLGMLEEHADLEPTRIPFFMEDMSTYHKHLDRIAEVNGLTDDMLTCV